MINLYIDGSKVYSSRQLSDKMGCAHVTIRAWAMRYKRGVLFEDRRYFTDADYHFFENLPDGRSKECRAQKAIS